MKPNSAELRTLLSTREFFAADLWTLTLVDGTVARYCSGDLDITANGFLYSAGGQVGPYWDRSDNKAKCHWKTGTDADSLIVDVIPGTAQIEGAYFLDAVRKGVFDAAEVMLERAFMPTYGDTSRGVLRYFIGRMAEIDAGRSVITFAIKSHVELLNAQFPRNIAQPGCLNNLGDSICNVDLTNASYRTTGTVSSGTTTGVINATIVGSWSAGNFDLGTIAFTSGALSGSTFGVKSVTYGSPAIITLIGYLPSIPANGDAFTLRFGCNKSYTDPNGCSKFTTYSSGSFTGNQARFRGLPFVPQPSAAV